MRFSLIGTLPQPVQPCRPNYFMGAPAIDIPSQKVLVADKLATTCPVNGSNSSNSGGGITGIVTLAEGGTGAALTGIPGGIVYAASTTQLGITDAGSSGYVLVSNGAGKPYWSTATFPLVVGPAGTILRSNGTGYLTSTATFVDTYPANAILFSNGANNVTSDAGFLWNNTTTTLQLGTTGVSIGVSAGVATSGVAIGPFAGQISQGDSAIAIGNSAGQYSQGPDAIAVGPFAGQTSQGSSAIAIGNLAGAFSQATNAIAMGFGAGQTSQQANAIAIGAAAGAVSQGPDAIAIGANAGQTFQGDSAIAIGNFAGASSQGPNAIAIGLSAGRVSQGDSAIAIGNGAGYTAQGAAAIALGTSAGALFQGSSAIAAGDSAGQFSQGSSAIAIGASAGNFQQQTSAIALGPFAGQTSQQTSAIAIGNSAGQYSQGANAIAIGAFAGQTSQVTGSIILNASGAALNATQAGFYVNPVRTAAVAANSLTLAVTGNEIVINSAKTFVIDHPLKPETHYLVHACLEGPEAGVYYRGTGKILKGEKQTTIDLPAYVSKLATDFTVQLTSITTFDLLRTNGVAGQFEVLMDELAIEEVEFFWVVMGCRQKIDVEVRKDQVQKQGQGPYQYLRAQNSECWKSE